MMHVDYEEEFTLEIKPPDGPTPVMLRLEKLEESVALIATLPNGINVTMLHVEMGGCAGIALFERCDALPFPVGRKGVIKTRTVDE